MGFRALMSFTLHINHYLSHETLNMLFYRSFFPPDALIRLPRCVGPPYLMAQPFNSATNSKIHFSILNALYAGLERNKGLRPPPVVC